MSLCERLWPGLDGHPIASGALALLGLFVGVCLLLLAIDMIFMGAGRFFGRD